MLYPFILAYSSKLASPLKSINRFLLIGFGGLMTSLSPISVEAQTSNLTTQAPTSPALISQISEPETATTPTSITPGQRALIEELLTLTRQEELFQQTLTGSINQITSNLPAIMESMMGEAADAEAIADSQATLERISTKLIAGFQREIKFQDVAENVFYPLYAQNFTEAQLEDMIAFYQTPTGQHSIEVMPKLLQDSMGLTQQHLMPTMIQIMQNVMAEEMER